jgi:hypothetical protein
MTQHFFHLFPFVRDGELHQLEAEQVVHVHALRPPLFVPDLGLVLQVAHDLRLSGQLPGVNVMIIIVFGDFR